MRIALSGTSPPWIIPTAMSTSPKIIPFRVLLRLVPRAIALMRRVIAARSTKRVRPRAEPAQSLDQNRAPVPAEFEEPSAAA
jgi:hypothetical protein